MSAENESIQDSRKWAGRPVVSFLLRTAVYVVPIVASVVFSIWLSRRLPRPDTLLGIFGWFALLVAVSTVVLFVADKLMRKMLPLAALLAVSMVFPDQSPSRFKTALRSGSSVKNLKALIAEAEALDETDISQSAELVLSLTTALNAHDPRTRGHAERVRAYTDMLAEEMGLTEEERAKLRWASVLHDIGKLKVSSDILNKPGKLDDQEWVEIKQHPVYGESICGPLLDWLGEWSGAIRHHHERFDGNGYPDGLKGEEISRAGRIVCVADAYDVMTTIRSYKKPMPNDEAREELARHAGSQFDPEVVRAFLKISMGRLRWVAGPLSWLTQLPFLNVLGGVAQNVGTTVGVAAAAGTVSAAVIGAGIVELPIQGLDLLPVPETLQQYDTDSPLVATTPPPPVAAGVAANDDRFEVAGANPVTLDVLANDVGVSSATIAVITQPGFGTVIVNANGTVTYIPADGYTGPDRFTYQVTNADGSSSQGVVELGVLNTAPVAKADAAELDEDDSVVIDVLINDADTEGLDPATLKVTVLPANGVATVLTDGRIRYVPAADFAGIDSLTYSITDLGGLTSTAVVTITVRPVNDLPEIRGEFASVVEDGVAVVNVVANDTDSDGTIDPATLTVTSPPIFGTATASASGTITYTPFADVNGTDIVVYRVCDSDGGCGTANLVMTISAVNDPPTAPGPGVLSVTEDETASFDPLAGAVDVDGNTVTLFSFDPVSAAGGTIVEGSLIYKPPANYSGMDTFSYRITDGTAVVSILVTVNVTDIQHPPVPGVVPGVVAEDSFLIADPAGAASDADGDPITLTGVTQPTNGAVAINPDGTITYTPTADFTGTDSFTYTITDGVTPITATVATTVTNVNDAPVALDDSASVVEDAPSHDIDVLANDSDIDGDALSATADLTGLTGGTVTDLGGGVFRFVPAGDFDGVATFSVVVSDGNGGTDSSTVTLTMTPLPDDPVGVDDAVGLNEDTTLLISPLANDYDPDTGDSFTLSAVDAAGILEGALVDNGNGTLTYTAGDDHHGVETFSYTVRDTTGRTDTATVTITIAPVPDAPIAGDDGYLTSKDVVLAVAAPGLLSNDVDHDEDPLTVDTTPVAPPLHGTLSLFADGSFTFAPDAGYSGTDAFVYTVRDPGGLTDTASVSVSVNSGVLGGMLYLGDVPDPSGDFALSTTAPAAGPPSDPVPDLDSDGNPGVTVVAGGGGLGESDPAKVVTWSFTPTTPLELDGPMFLDLWSTAAGFMPLDPGHIVMYILDCDSTDWGSCTTLIDSDTHRGDWNAGSTTWVNEVLTIGSIQHTVNIGRTLVLRVQFKHNDVWIANTTDYPSRFVFTAANRPPVANDDAYPGPSDPDYLEGSPLVNVDVVGNDFDADLDPGTLSISVAPGAGSAFARADGTIDYTPAIDAFGVDSLMYQVCDTNGECSMATLSVDVTPVNDVPTFTPGSDVVVLEDSGNYTAPWASTIALGPANEAGQKLDNLSGDEEFEVTVPIGAEAALFASLPSIDKDGDLKFKPADDANGTATVHVSLRDDGGTANGGVDQSAVVTFEIDITPVNDEPSFTKGSNVSVAEDSGAYSVGAPWATAIAMGPADESGQVGAFVIDGNDNPGLFAVAPTVDADGFLTFTPAGNASGTARIDLHLRDDGGVADGGDDTSPTLSFDIDVTEVNDQPTIDPITDPADVLEDAGAQSVAFSGVAAGGGESQTLTVTAVSSNAAIVPNPVVTYTSPAATGSLSWTPAANMSGSVTITVTVDDNSGAPNATIDETFVVTITPVNDEPSFTKGSNVSVAEDSGAYSVGVPWATVIAMGPADESGQLGTFVIDGNDNPGLFAVAPAVDPAGFLTFTPAANATGTARIDLYLWDDGGVADGGDDTSPTVSFDIDVTEVNDQPTIDPIADPADVLEDAGVQSVAFSGVNAGGGESQTLTVTAVSSNAAIVPNPVVTYTSPAATGSLSWTPAADMSGSVTITVTVDDNSGAPNATIDETFVVTITPVNDAPSFTHLGDQVVPRDAGPIVVPGFAAPTSFGPGEGSQSVLEYVITPTGVPTVTFFQAPAIDAAGQLTFEASPGDGGIATFDVQLRDNGGVANGGVNLSAALSLTINVDLPVYISELSNEGPEGFIELYNPSTTNSVDIAGWELKTNSPGFGITTFVISGADTILGPGEHYLFAETGAIHATYDQLLGYNLPSTIGIRLHTSSGASVDSVGLNGATWKEGTGLPALPVSATTPQSYERLGTSTAGNCVDTDDNALDFIQNWNYWSPQSTVDPGVTCGAALYVASSVAGVSELLINEVLYQQSTSGGYEEAVEIYNPTGAAVDLTGIRITDRQPFTGQAEPAFILDYTIPSGSLPANGYAVVWITGPTSVVGDLNYGPVAGGLALDTQADDLWLLDPAGAIIDYIAYGDPTTPGHERGTPIPRFLGMWEPSGEAALGSAADGQSISLTPSGTDSNDSACWEHTGAGTSGCGIATADTDGTALSVTSLGSVNHSGNADLEALGTLPATNPSNPYQISVGATAVIDISVVNNGPDTASTTMMRLALDPAKFTFQPGLSSATCVFNAIGEEVVCLYGNIASGSRVSQTVAFTVVAANADVLAAKFSSPIPDPVSTNNTGDIHMEATNPPSGPVVSMFTSDRVDDVVEIYNPTSIPIPIAGYQLWVYPQDNAAGSLVATVGGGTPDLLPGQHYLFANTGSFGGADHDVTFDVGLYGGVELRDSLSNPLDGVGTADRPGGPGGAASREGIGVPPMTPGPTPQWMARKLGSSLGNCIDTDANENDWFHAFGIPAPRGTVNGLTVPVCGAPPPPPPSTATTLVISEFRGDGPAGGDDEFIEIFNPTGTAIVVDASWRIEVWDAGWLLAYQWAGATSIESGGHWLITSPTYSGPVAGDGAYPGNLKNGGGMRLLSGVTIIDLVGMDTSPSEGTALASFAGRGIATYERRAGGASGSCIDSDDNSADFVFRLAQDPQNSLSDPTPCS